MYLCQMGRIPLLSRKQELALAKQIEATRTEFSRLLLGCDYGMREAVALLRRVRDGEARLDRTVQVPAAGPLDASRLRGRLLHNLETLESLLERNRSDYRLAASKSLSIDARREAWRRLQGSRRQAVRLVEELGFKTETIQCAIGELAALSRRADDLKARIDAHRNAGGPPRRARAVAGRALRHPEDDAETPAGLHDRVLAIERAYSGTRRPSRPCARGTSAWSSRSPRSTRTGA